MESVMCSICCEDEDISILKCPYCNFDVCDECVMKFLLTTIDIKCMNCNKIWNKEFFYTNFPKSWINNKYKPYKKNLIFEREKSMMPQTQEFVELEIIERKYQEQFNFFKKEIKEIYKEYNEYITKNNIIDIIPNYERSIHLHTKLLEELVPEKYDFENFKNSVLISNGFYYRFYKQREYDCSPENIYILSNKVYIASIRKFEQVYFLQRRETERTKKTKQEKDEAVLLYNNEYKKKCTELTEKYLKSYNESSEEVKNLYKKYSLDLHNFKHRIATNRTLNYEVHQNYNIAINKITNTEDKKEKSERTEVVRPCPKEDCRGFLKKWECGLCETKVCNKCLIIKKNKDHECKQEDIETANLLKDKDTKNCPSCGTYISKVTGCDQMWCPNCRCAFSWTTLKIETGIIHNPHYYEWKRNNGGLERNVGDNNMCGNNYLPVWLISTENRNISNFLDRLYAFSQDIRTLRLPALPQANTEQDNRDCRIKYMLKDYNENMFKKLIYSREKKRDSDIDIRQILEMFIAVVQDTLLDYYQTKIMVGQAQVNILLELVNYANNAFRRLEPIYDLKMPFIKFYDVLNTFEYQAKMVEDKSILLTNLELEKKKIPELKELVKKVIVTKNIKIKGGYSKWKKAQYIEFLKQNQ